MLYEVITSFQDWALWESLKSTINKSIPVENTEVAFNSVLKAVPLATLYIKTDHENATRNLKLIKQNLVKMKFTSSEIGRFRMIRITSYNVCYTKLLRSLSWGC